MTDKERLEELKEWFNNDQEIHEFQIEWLIERAEKLEEIKTVFMTDEFTITEFLRMCKEIFKVD